MYTMKIRLIIQCTINHIFVVYIYFYRLNGNMFSCDLELVEVHKPREEVAVVQWCLDTMVRTRGGGIVRGFKTYINSKEAIATVIQDKPFPVNHTMGSTLNNNEEVCQGQTKGEGYFSMFKVSYGYKKEKRDARSNCLGSKETNQPYPPT